MSTFVIKGGNRLNGTIDVSSGKNSPIYLLCASLAIRGKTTLFNVSRVDEVDKILQILRSIGVVCEWKDKHTLSLDASNDLDLKKIDKPACLATRASLLLFGALAAREKSYILYRSGGCKLGERTVRPHVFALEKLGVQVKTSVGKYEIKNSPLHSAKIVMYESSDTATANAILAAVLAPGITKIVMASANYMVQSMCYYLVSAGAKIDGLGTTTLTITGIKKLHDVKSYTILPDPVDAMTWISLAITTHSPLTVAGCPIDFLELELEKLRVMGQKFELKNERIFSSGGFTLADIYIIPSRLSALPDKIYGRPFPGLNIDNLPLFIPILTTAKGRTLVHDWVYENRAIYSVDFQKLGGKIMLLDPHRILVEGPTSLKGTEIICPPAIRPAVALLIAACAAKGMSILRNVAPIERGYDNLLPRLKKVGVHIERKD